MLIYSWIAFWATYFLGTFITYNTGNLPTGIIRSKKIITAYEIMNTIKVNACLTFLLLPITEQIPTLIYVPDTWLGYLLRITLALIIGDLCFYITHRLLHHPYLYKYHQKHHEFIVPYSLTGLYSSPVEMILSNHLSMVIPLKLITSHSNTMLMLESAAVAFNILKSHSGYDSELYGSPHHNIHHKYMIHNYGFLYITDIIFGTYSTVQ